MPAAVTRHNQWTDDKCAKAFWDQKRYSAYVRLLEDTVDWAAPSEGEKWLDLGCGSGPLSEAIWRRTRGLVREVVGIDCAGVNAGQYNQLQSDLSADPSRFRFVRHNFSEGLSIFEPDCFDHVISGLSISYAESWDEASQSWNQSAYDRILAEVARVLRPGGRFVFSVNVPSPSWARVGLSSAGSLLTTRQTLRFLKKSYRMLRYGAWLKREARAGRFHYLPHAEVAKKLAAAGFEAIDHRLTYAGQAYVFRATKPAGGVAVHKPLTRSTEAG